MVNYKTLVELDELPLTFLSDTLPDVLAALGGHNATWAGVLATAAWLTAAALEQHPEAADGYFALVGRLAQRYEQMVAEFLAQHPDETAKLCNDDAVWVLVP